MITLVPEDGSAADGPARLHGAALDPERPPAGAAEDWTVPQRWNDLGAEDHAVWDLLFARQTRALAGRAARAFLEGLDLLRLSRPGIPDFEELNRILLGRTGWTVVAVPGLIPDDIFFDHLRNRRFPAGNFIRRRSQLDYLVEPDVFHDVFGHVPLLAHPAMAESMQKLGERGLSAISAGSLHRLARFYWYVVEFGLLREEGGLKISGAGIASSYGESRFALESPEPHRVRFDLDRVLRTDYRSDRFQQTYFVLDSLDELPELVERLDFERLEPILRRRGEADPASVLPEDRLVPPPVPRRAAA